MAKKLEFTCPECGGKRAECCEVNAYVTSVIKTIDADGDFDYESPIIENSDVIAFQCAGCGYRPQNKYGDIRENLEFVKWLKKNQK